YQDHTINYNNGYGYIEKDWGKSFPESWIWMQCNHFTYKNSCFMFSIAKIPWFATSFIGFISFLRVGDDHYTFATYNNSRVKYLNRKGNLLFFCLDNRRYQIQVQVKISTNTGKLMAPKTGSMSREIEETIDSKIHVHLSDQKDNVIFSDTG